MECVKQRAKLLFHILGSITGHLKGLDHHIRAVVTHSAGGQLHAVTHNVVLISLDLRGLLVQQRVHLALGHRERIVGKDQLAVIIPLKHGEVGDKAQVEPILVDQIQATT